MAACAGARGGGAADGAVANDASGPPAGARAGGAGPAPCEGPPRPLDVLVVVDNSATIRDDQAVLRRGFETLVLGLERLAGGLPDLHVGVISTDLGAGPEPRLPGCPKPGGDGAVLLRPRGCWGPEPERFIRAAADGDDLDANVPDVASAIGDGAGNVTACEPRDGGDGRIDLCDVAAAFACLANLGSSGCGWEQPLEAARVAVSDAYVAPGGPNAGFLREDSVLAIVAVTDEDDCSAADPEFFAPGDHPVLGPEETYRCFDFGARCGDLCAYGGCSGPLPRGVEVTLTDCVAVDVRDLGPGERSWLVPPSEYADHFATFRAGRPTFFVAIAGRWRPGDPVTLGQDRSGDTALKPVCAGAGAPEQSAYPAPRLAAVAAAMGEQGLLAADVGASLCDEDPAPLWDTLAERFARATECCPE